MFKLATTGNFSSLMTVCYALKNCNLIMNVLQNSFDTQKRFNYLKTKTFRLHNELKGEFSFEFYYYNRIWYPKAHKIFELRTNFLKWTKN